MKKIMRLVVAIMAAILFVQASTGLAQAAKGDQGVDWAKYQGYYGKFGYGSDKFVLAQIGGHNSGGLYDQDTYPTQVQSAIAQGKRVHSYFWWENVFNQATVDQLMNYTMPKVQTPKGSIVAIDFEAGAGNAALNTQLIKGAMQRIKNAGYTPMLYGYKSFLQSNVYLDQIIGQFGTCLWVGEYPDYNVTPKPNYNFFPSMDGVAIFQFTSTYILGGLDGNVDLTGITDNGYTKHDNPVTETPATDAGQAADNTHKSQIEVGNTVKVNFSAQRWATGEGIPSFIKGQSYKVIQVAGDRVLLDGVLSWANKKDVEIISTTTGNSTSGSSYTVQWGDSWWAIANRYGMSMYNLAAINGKSINTMLYPGQVLQVSGTTTTNRTYAVRYGDNLSTIANRLGTTWQQLANRNGIGSPYWIYPGQALVY
ncbi:LysM peptidoglycan-binding domain-containing protein [Latilactobacillus curvatus]|uniref:LysM peptidoglycan-binding domain-containing protein n=1 Tax=Latilactobacillus curvatus TaxID=28038 RepID=UPI0020C8198E|nr:LysM peptidoglycan-binding domain-containing protein [Latilactobacillus curvatus]MCP8849198.1 LysM peptidoglycan-binding domain-containing protein [Latilactobacillus curvatus]